MSNKPRGWNGRRKIWIVRAYDIKYDFTMEGTVRIPSIAEQAKIPSEMVITLPSEAHGDTQDIAGTDTDLIYEYILEFISDKTMYYVKECDWIIEMLDKS